MGLVQPVATRRSATGIQTGKLAVWWLIGSEIVIFGGLLMSYISLRLLHDSWSAESAHTNMWLGATNTFILLTSSLFVVLAHHAAEHGDKEKAFKYLWITIAFGLGFLVVKGFEWTGEIQHGLTITKSLFWAFYYVAAGIHGLHVIGGMIIMAMISFDVKKNKNLQRVEYIGLYWHFVDIVWIFLFPLLYIAK